jgi:hypothetical protein
MNMLVKDPMRHKFRPWCDFYKQTLQSGGEGIYEATLNTQLDPENHGKTGLTQENQGKLISN